MMLMIRYLVLDIRYWFGGIFVDFCNALGKDIYIIYTVLR